MPPPAGAPQPTPVRSGNPYEGKTWNGQRWINPDGTAFAVAKAPMSTGAKILLGIMAALVVGAIAISFVGNRSASRFDQANGGTESAIGGSNTAPDSHAWIPAGYNPSNDPNLAWRWHDGDADCGYYDSCADIDVVTRTGCPSGVFVEMAQVEASGALLNNSNDIGPALAPGGSSVITVGWLDDGPGTRLNKVQVTRMNCM
ncbi:MAG: hypothetical protein KGP12_10530 [Actinomycetales bacterium]|nr:hypothetical protein [Actinomycetales bacterium]